MSTHRFLHACVRKLASIGELEIKTQYTMHMCLRMHAQRPARTHSTQFVSHPSDLCWHTTNKYTHLLTFSLLLFLAFSQLAPLFGHACACACECACGLVCVCACVSCVRYALSVKLCERVLFGRKATLCQGALKAQVDNTSFDIRVQDIWLRSCSSETEYTQI